MLPATSLISITESSSFGLSLKVNQCLLSTEATRIHSLVCIHPLKTRRGISEWMWLLIELISLFCLYSVAKWSAAFMAFPWSTGCARLQWKETQEFRLEKKGLLLSSLLIRCSVMFKGKRGHSSKWAVKLVCECLSISCRISTWGSVEEWF